jgi:hypothetical protein
MNTRVMLSTLIARNNSLFLLIKVVNCDGSSDTNRELIRHLNSGFYRSNTSCQLVNQSLPEGPIAAAER